MFKKNLQFKDNEIKYKELLVFSSPTRLSFRLTAEQLKTVQDSFDVFGDTKIGRGQVIKKIPIDILCRSPVIISKTKN